MKQQRRLPKSVRKHIRREKARLRKEVQDLEEYTQRVAALYAQFRSHPKE